MRRATAVKLVLLGGGLTLVGTLSVVSERHRTQACLERQAHEPPGAKEDCRTSRSGGGGSHGGGGGGGGYGSGEDEGHSSTGGEVARGGFGGSGGEGGGE